MDEEESYLKNLDLDQRIFLSLTKEELLNYMKALAIAIEEEKDI